MNIYDVETVNYFLALGTIALQLITIVFFILYFLRKHAGAAEIRNSIARWGILIAFVVSLGSAALTLFYSEVLGIEPCPLCWWQRIFLYPQVILFALALWDRRNFSFAGYSIALSVIGLGFALYHHALQILPSGTLPCPATGTVSCATRFVYEFGYITFPLMAATLFAFLVALMLFVRDTEKKN